ncbi:hypothetical protein GOODEAATRI_006760, partial [Goodea atripinnis]
IASCSVVPAAVRTQAVTQESIEGRTAANTAPLPARGAQLRQNCSAFCRSCENVGEQGHMALLGHSLAAYISVLDRERLRKLTTRILSDTTLWLCRIFSLCTVPCNTIFGSQHQMDVALLDKLIKEDIDAGKLPLLLIANAGEGQSFFKHSISHYAATRSDSMTLTPGRWLGLPAVTAVSLYRHEDPALVGSWPFNANSEEMLRQVLVTLSSFVSFALCICRSSQSLAAGLTSSQPVEKLRALPLWLSLQYLGHNGIVQKIKHAAALVRMT